MTTVTIPPAFTTPIALLTEIDVVANTAYDNQPKTFVGNDGYYYAFYTDFDTGYFYYSSSPDGTTWTQSGALGNPDVYVGYQFSTYYDPVSNTVAYVRAPITSVTGDFLIGFGSPSGGSISWTASEIDNITTHGAASPGSVSFPSIAWDGSLFWIAVTTSPNGTDYYTEIWTYNPGTTTWAQVLDAGPNPSNIQNSIIPVNGGMLWVSGDLNSPTTLYQTTNGGSSWTGPVTTVNSWILLMGGYTVINDTVYFGAVDNSYDLGAISFKLNDPAWVETQTGLNPFLNVLGGASISTDGTAFFIVWTEEATSNVFFTYSTPFGTLDLTSVTWSPAITISTGDNLPAYPQLYSQSISHSRPSTVLTWTNMSTAVMACIVFTPFAGTLIAVTDTAFVEDMISVQVFYHTIPPSGAYPLSPPETDYVSLSYQQLIDMSGTPVTYRIQNIVGDDEYEHPIINFKNVTINAFITILGNDEYEYVEQGLLPNHYANMWVYQVKPKVGDHVLWNGIEWEVRNSIPKVIGGQTFYYRTLLRRVLASVPPELGAGLPGDGGVLPTGTLNSGGQQLPPTGDP